MALASDDKVAILRLKHRKDDVEKLSSTLKPKSYISSTSRFLIKLALQAGCAVTIFEPDQIHTSMTIRLRFDSLRALPMEQWEFVIAWIKNLLDRWDVFDSISAATDQERFLEMIDQEGGISSNFVPKFTGELDVVTVRTDVRRRKFIVTGTMSEKDFYEKVQACLGFSNPRTIFEYGGGYSIPFGQQHRSYVTAGMSLSAFPSLLPQQQIKGYGTIGGLFQSTEGRFYCVTAKHCINEFEGCVSKGDSIIVPLSLPGEVQYMNPLFIDDDSYAHDRFLKTTMRSRRTSFELNDPTPAFNEVIDHFPFLLASQVEPGTRVLKDGATTGITEGLFLDYYGLAKYKTGNDDEVSLKNVILIRHLPNSRFSSGGDSGSLIYVQRGTLRFPIAVHAGEFNHVTQSIYGKENSETVSYGILLWDLIEEFGYDKVVWPLKFIMMGEVVEYQDHEGEVVVDVC